MKSKEDIEREFRRSDAEWRMRNRYLNTLKKLPFRPMMGVAGSDPTTILLLSRDPSKPREFRITRFDQETREPYGHSEHPSYEDALRSLFMDWRVLPPYTLDAKPIKFGDGL